MRLRLCASRKNELEETLEVKKTSCKQAMVEATIAANDLSDNGIACMCDGSMLLDDG